MKTLKKQSILSGVSFVQWIEGSDVAVAQRGNRLAVWYNIDLPDHPTIVNIQGNVVDITRDKEKTQAIAVEGSNTLVFDLDDGLVEFGIWFFFMVFQIKYDHSQVLLCTKTTTAELLFFLKLLMMVIKPNQCGTI